MHLYNEMWTLYQNIVSFYFCESCSEVHASKNPNSFEVYIKTTFYTLILHVF